MSTLTYAVVAPVASRNPSLARSSCAFHRRRSRVRAFCMSHKMVAIRHISASACDKAHMLSSWSLLCHRFAHLGHVSLFAEQDR
jgi:hypothetical protein